jgi:hypothetical protein
MYNLGNFNNGEDIADDFPLPPKALALNDPAHPMRMNWCGIINEDDFLVSAYKNMIAIPLVSDIGRCLKPYGAAFTKINKRYKNSQLGFTKPCSTRLMRSTIEIICEENSPTLCFESSGVVLYRGPHHRSSTRSTADPKCGRVASIIRFGEKRVVVRRCQVYFERAQIGGARAFFPLVYVGCQRLIYPADFAIVSVRLGPRLRVWFPRSNLLLQSHHDHLLWFQTTHQ